MKVNVRLFITDNEAYIIEQMIKYNFKKVVGLRIKPADYSKYKEGAKIDFPTSTGTVIYWRRNIFRFWKKEALVRQTEPDGTYYTWYPEDMVTFE